MLSDPDALAALLASNAPVTEKKEEAKETTKPAEPEEDESDDDMGMGNERGDPLIIV